MRGDLTIIHVRSDVQTERDFVVSVCEFSPRASAFTAASLMRPRLPSFFDGLGVGGWGLRDFVPFHHDLADVSFDRVVGDKRLRAVQIFQVILEGAVLVQYKVSVSTDFVIAPV